MYLTRFAVNTSRHGARRLLASPHRLHAAVLAAFPPDADQGRVLWRIDEGGHRTDLFLVSRHRPDLTHLVEEAGWPTSSSWDTASYQPFLDRLAVGQTWAFRLRANPVRRVSRGEGLRGTVKAHVTPVQQQDWLLRRASGLGFSVPEGTSGVPGLVVKNRSTARFQRAHSEPGRDVTIVMATFEGILDVTDPDAMRTTLTQGVGRAKAYGCGLLTLARP